MNIFIHTPSYWELHPAPSFEAALPPGADRAEGGFCSGFSSPRKCCPGSKKAMMAWTLPACPHTAFTSPRRLRRPCPHSPSALRDHPRLRLPSPAAAHQFAFAVRPSHLTPLPPAPTTSSPPPALCLAWCPSTAFSHHTPRFAPACHPRPSPRLCLALPSGRRPCVDRDRIAHVASHSHNTDVRLLILNGVGCRTSVRVWGSPDNTDRGVQSTCV